MARLRGKVAGVTGANSGIGRAIPQLVAQEGTRVTLVDVTTGAAEETAAAIRTAAGEALVVQGDASSGAAWTRATSGLAAATVWAWRAWGQRYTDAVSVPSPSGAMPWCYAGHGVVGLERQ